ncbi:MAG: serine hydrolase domain-containing protein [Chloroflexota bacterium]
MIFPTDEIDGLFAPWARPDSPGCALGVIWNGELVYARGYGMANLEHDIPISPRTVFRIASTSKQFVAACIVLLAGQEKLTLDDDIRTFLPQMPPYERPITLRHLVHHTSGIRDYLSLMSLAGMRDDDFFTNDEAVEMIGRQKGLNFAPGEQYLYSNSGYYLLGAIVQRVSGQTLRQYAQENIFGPLGMAHTHFHDDHTEIVKNRAAGYTPHGEGGFRICMTTLDMVGDGGLFTTVEDLLLWDRNFYHNRLGQGGQALIQQLLAPGRLNDGRQLDYAFGLEVSNHRGLTMVSHGGAFVGFRAEMIRFPQQALSVICLANLSTFEPTWLAKKVADLCLAGLLGREWAGRTTPAETEDCQLAAEDVADKVGVYHSPASDAVLELALEDDKLVAGMWDQRLGLVPVSPTEFRAEEPAYAVRLVFEHKCVAAEEEQPQNPWLIRLSEGESPPDTLEAVAVVAVGGAQLEAYVGAYHSAELDVTHHIVVKDGRLHLVYRGASEEPLKPGYRDMFWHDQLTLHFERDAVGQVSTMRLSCDRARNILFVRRTA